MRKLVISCLAIAALGLASCGGDEDPADISTDDIESACDCVDAAGKIADRMLELLEGEETKEAEEEYEKLEEKMNEVNKHCKENFEHDEAKKCDNYEEVRDKMKDVR